MSVDSPAILRAEITAGLRLASPMHIGAGVGSDSETDGGDTLTDLAIVTDVDGAPVIPGSSLRGALRALCTDRHPDQLNPLFGFIEPLVDRGECGALSVFAARMTNIMPLKARTGHARNPVTGAVADHQLYSRQVAAAGTCFGLRIVLRRVSEAQMQVVADLVAALADSGALGGGKRSGLGAFDGKHRLELCALVLSEVRARKWLSGVCAGAAVDWREHAQKRSLRPRKAVPDPGWKIRLHPQAPFHVWNSELGERKGKTTNLPPSMRQGSKALIPGSSLKGALRAIARRLVMSDLVERWKESDARPSVSVCAGVADAAVGALFGSAEAAGSLWVSDQLGEEWRGTERTFVALDRFTGGAAAGRLYSREVLWCERLDGSLRWEPPSDAMQVRHKMTAGAMALLLAATLREARNGFYLGAAAGRGLGEMRLAWVDEAHWQSLIAQADENAWSAWLERARKTHRESLDG